MTPRPVQHTPGVEADGQAQSFTHAATRRRVPTKNFREQVRGWPRNAERRTQHHDSPSAERSRPINLSTDAKNRLHPCGGRNGLSYPETHSCTSLKRKVSPSRRATLRMAAVNKRLSNRRRCGRIVAPRQKSMMGRIRQITHHLQFWALP